MTTKPFFLIACATSVALLISAPSSLASILHTAGNFTLLGGTAITSTGVAGTLIRNGNVGLSPGATTGITGFPPAVIENGAIVPTSSVTRQARLDLIKAQVGLAGMASDKILSNVDLAGKILSPGVYTFSGSANLNGALVLDAHGRNGAFWVFQIGAALTTSGNSSVTVINLGSHGGEDCGIFWNAGTAIMIGANNHIAGNYLAGTSITFGGTTSGEGRALALAGITLDNDQIDSNGGPSGSDWSGGLKYDASGAVVPEPGLAFRYFGKPNRTTHGGTTSIHGDATVTAADIQWRVTGGNWHTVFIQDRGEWQFSVNAGPLPFGSNKIQIHARDTHGHQTAIQQLFINHLP